MSLLRVCLRRGSPATRPTVGGADRAVVAARSQLHRRSAGVRDPDRASRSALGMTPLGTTTDRPGRRTVLQVMPTPSTRADEAVRGWGPELRRGFVQVLVARDPPLLLRSRRAKAVVALATWMGAALLARRADRAVAESAAGRRLRHSLRDRRQSFATPDGRRRRECSGCSCSAFVIRFLPGGSAMLALLFLPLIVQRPAAAFDRAPSLLLGRRPAPRARHVLGDVPADAACRCGC